MPAAPLLLAAAALLAPADADSDAANWPRFRGPDGAGVAAGAFPDTFTPADLLWAAPLPGSGVSSPAVWGDAVFVTAADGPRRLLMNLDAADGSVRWTKEVDLNPAGPPAAPKLHAKNDPAASTPALDAGRAFTIFSDGVRIAAHAFTHAGEPLWRRDLGPFAGQHGHGTSPVRVDAGGRELVVLSNFQTEVGGVLALDAATGEIVWTAPHDSREAAYATPVPLRRDDGTTVLLTASGAAGLIALDAATGEALWETGPLPSRVVASPVLAGGKAWALCGQGGAGKLLIAADPADGTVLLERTRALPYVPTPVAANGLLFLWGDRGVVTALDPSNGAEVWTERVGGNFSASPVAVGDAVVNLTEDGVATVIAASRTFELRGQTDLGRPTNATPAVAGGRAFIRLTDRLLCLPLDAP